MSTIKDIGNTGFLSYRPTRIVYLTITNSGNRTRTITGIHAVGFQMAHFHLTEVIDELTSMKSLHSLDVKPGQTLIFEPGGLHIMLSLIHI